MAEGAVGAAGVAGGASRGSRSRPGGRRGGNSGGSCCSCCKHDIELLGWDGGRHNWGPGGDEQGLGVIRIMSTNLRRVKRDGTGQDMSKVVWKETMRAVEDAAMDIWAAQDT